MVTLFCYPPHFILYYFIAVMSALSTHESFHIEQCLFTSVIALKKEWRKRLMKARMSLSICRRDIREEALLWSRRSHTCVCVACFIQKRGHLYNSMLTVPTLVTAVIIVAMCFILCINSIEVLVRHEFMRYDFLRNILGSLRRIAVQKYNRA
jgi:hypothetical protein